MEITLSPIRHRPPNMLDAVPVAHAPVAHALACRGGIHATIRKSTGGRAESRSSTLQRAVVAFMPPSGNPLEVELNLDPAR
jgi:hypothetical protein